MTRKITAIAQLKLRIREDLRRRLEQAAKKRDASLNFEMTDRLRASFDQETYRTLDQVTAGLEGAYARFARETRDRLQTQELMAAAEGLIKELSATDASAAVKRSIAAMQEAITAIARVHGRTYDHEPWEK